MSSELRALWESAGGQVPPEWEVVALESLLRDSKSIAVGIMYPGPNTPNGIPLIKVGDIKAGQIQSCPAYRVSQEVNHEYRRTQLQGDELLITLVGNPGECVVVQPHMAGWNPARAIAALRLKAPSIRTYLKTVLESRAGKHLIDAVLNTTVQKTLNLKDIKRLPIPLPSSEAICSISEMAEALSSRITLLRETNATLEAIAQALFKSWFVDFDPVRAKMEGRAPEGMDEATAALFPDSFEESELRLVPKGWRVMPFLDACDLQGGSQPPASNFVDAPRDGYVRLLQIRDFSTDAHKTYIPDTSKLKKVTEDDVLLGRYGSASGDKAKDSLGRVCRGLSGAYNVALMKLVPILIGREFALQLVNDPQFYNYLQGVSSKAVQSGFSKSELAQYKVVLPSQELIDAYELIGQLAWQKIKANRDRLVTLAALRDLLLPRLISGQLRFSELNALLRETA